MRSMPLETCAGSMFAMACVGAAGALAAHAVLLGRVVFFLLVMLILGTFWDSVAADHVAGAIALPPGIVVYVGIAEWITFSVPALHLRLEDDIRSGAIEAHLLRPMPYLLARISETVGGLIVRLGAIGVAGAVLLAASGRAAPPAASWPLIMAMGVTGGIVGVLLVAIVGLTAFWVRRCIAFFLILQKLTFLLGGLFIPVTLYPHWLVRIAVLSPFAANLYWPAVLSLHHDTATVLAAAIASLAWIALLALLCAGIWRAGLRRLLTTGV